MDVEDGADNLRAFQFLRIFHYWEICSGLVVDGIGVVFASLVACDDDRKLD